MMKTVSNEQFSDHFNFLIVDDHDFMIHLIRETLISAHAGEIHRAMNGLDAISVLKKIRKADFVITDFNMPKMNGLNFLRSIRLGEANIARETPVIMLSGFDDEPLLSTALEFDANGFIHKPFTKIDLVSRLNKVFMQEGKIKSVEEYRKIPLPDFSNDWCIDSGPTFRGVPGEIKAGGVSTPLEQVAVGSLIVADIRTSNGIVLVQEGSRVSAALIDFLIKTKDVTKISDIVVRQL